MTNHLVGLWTLLPLNDVELDLVPLFQTFVPINLDGAVVDENVGSVVSSDESVAFGVVKPLDFAFVLRHEPYLPWNTISIGFERQPAFLRDAEWVGLVFLRAVEKREEDGMTPSNAWRRKFVSKLVG